MVNCKRIIERETASALGIYKRIIQKSAFKDERIIRNVNATNVNSYPGIESYEVL